MKMLPEYVIRLLSKWPSTVALLLPLYGVAAHAESRDVPDDKAPGVYAASPVESEIMEILRHEGADGIKGIWQMTGGGAVVAIVPLTAWERTHGIIFKDKKRSLASEYILILLDSPSPRLQPGTVMGWGAPSAKPGVYEAWLYTKEKGFTLTSRKKFIMTLADDGHLTLRAVHKGITINPWRFLPYMFRGAVRFRDDTPADLNGFIRLWPEPMNPQQPRYL